MANPKESLTHRQRILIMGALACHDALMAALAMETALWLRYQFSSTPQPFFSLWEATLTFTLVAAAVFFAHGLHRGIWRYTAFSNLVTIVQAALVSVLVFVPALFVATRLETLPRSAIFLVVPLLIIFLALPRTTYRIVTSGNLRSAFLREDISRVPVLLIGSGDDADAFIRETQRARSHAFRVVGIAVRDPAMVGRDIRGVRILGTLDDIDRIFDKLAFQNRRPQRLVLTGPRFDDGNEVRSILEVADRLGVSLSRAARPTELRAEDANGSRLELQPIDVADLLGRPQKVLDRPAMEALVQNRRVMVTGAGGTIGSELCRQIAALGPSSLLLVDQGEYALYQIDLEIGESFDGLTKEALLADVRDKDLVDRMFREHRPDIVFHAAALKHVPLIEFNAREGVLTNVGGTKNVADACISHGISAMVLISSDKAVNPSSVMGTTKRIAELYCQSQAIAQPATRFVTVRFGNVLGSTGSVVPLFQRQMARGGPLTVTHPEMTRYFMTTREAVELVLQAAALPRDASEAGSIFVLDMGEPVRIADLAKQMVRLSGLRPSTDIQIEFTGLRPGEKLYENLFHEGEPPGPTPAEGVLLAHPRAVDLKILKPDIERLLEAAQSHDEESLFRLVHLLVPEFDSPRAVSAGAQRAVTSE